MNQSPAGYSDLKTFQVMYQSKDLKLNNYEYILQSVFLECKTCKSGLSLPVEAVIKLDSS